jgi:high affinity sulfate transporter 1
VRYPIAGWLFSYRKEWLRPDVIAGLTTAAVVIPKAMAYATIAGLPVQIGLYTALVPPVIYALLGTSRVLSVTTTTTIAILTAAELTTFVPGGDPAALLSATATLTLLVGAILVGASALRLGFVANFISEPVLIGFKAGIGVVIVLDQIPKLLGTHITKGNFLQNLLATIRSVPDAKLITLAVGVSIIVLLIAIERFVPKVPAPLVGLAAGIGGAYLLNLHARGVELVGHIPTGLPSFTAPSLELAAQLWPGALGIALMSFTETIAAGRAFAKDDEQSPRANQELVATGLANAAGAVLGAMPGGGGTSQTAINRLAGGRTQLTEFVTAAMTLLTLLLLAPLLALMPQATLAAVVIVYSVGLIKPDEFRKMRKVRTTEFRWALVAFAGVVLVGTLKGILVAIIVSLLALAYQLADPPVYVLARKRGTNVFRPRSEEHPEDETFPGLLLLRPEGRIFFANAEQIAQKIRRLTQEIEPKVVAIDLTGVVDIEYTALKMLTHGAQRQREQGRQLWLVGLNPGVLAMIQRSKLGQALGREGMHFNLEIAVAKYLGGYDTQSGAAGSSLYEAAAENPHSSQKRA